MKKVYEQPTIEVTVFKDEDIITTSSTTTTTYDPDGILNKNPFDKWFS